MAPIYSVTLINVSLVQLDVFHAAVALFVHPVPLITISTTTHVSQAVHKQPILLLLQQTLSQSLTYAKPVLRLVTLVPLRQSASPVSKITFSMEQSVNLSATRDTISTHKASIIMMKIPHKISVIILNV